MAGALTGIRKDCENRLDVDKIKIVSKVNNFLACIVIALLISGVGDGAMSGWFGYNKKRCYFSLNQDCKIIKKVAYGACEKIRLTTRGIGEENWGAQGSGRRAQGKKV